MRAHDIRLGGRWTLGQQTLDLAQSRDKLRLGRLRQRGQQRADLTSSAVLEWLEGGATSRSQAQPTRATVVI